MDDNREMIQIMKWLTVGLSSLCICGCAGGVFATLFAGTFAADVPCTLVATNEEGVEEELEFQQAITLRLDRGGDVFINDVQIELGAEVVRSIPTADLAFEVVSVDRAANGITIVYEPRPTLTGITVDGELVETYVWLPAGESVLATASADLVLTDVEQTVVFAIACEIALTPPQS